MLPLLLLLLDTPRIDGELLRTLDLAALSVHEARQFDGRLVRVAFTVDSLTEESEAGAVVEAAGPEDESRTVRYSREAEPENLTIGTRHVVEGFLLVKRHAPATHDGGTFPGFVEIRVVAARVAK